MHDRGVRPELTTDLTQTGDELKYEDLNIGMQVVVREGEGREQLSEPYTVLDLRDMPDGCIAWLEGRRDWIPIDMLELPGDGVDESSN